MLHAVTHGAPHRFVRADLGQGLNDHFAELP
jgi:hypothetical protein